MFQLHIADTNITSGCVAVSWCLDIELLKSLVEVGNNDPQVVIITAPVHETNGYSHDEYRAVVPLKDLMAYVNFKCEGQNKIYAFITQHTRSRAVDIFLAKSGRQYNTTLLAYEGNDYASNVDKEHDIDGNYIVPNEKLADPIEVFVPKEVFAKEPSAFEKAWVNHYFKNKLVDQCDFRRRRIFAYGVQPILIVILTILKICLLTLSFAFGLKETNYKTIFHPLSEGFSSLEDTFNPDRGSYFVKDIPVEKSFGTGFLPFFIKSFWAVPFMPIFLGLYTFSYFNKPCRHLLMFVGPCIIFAIIVISIVLFFVDGKYYKKYNDWLDKRNNNKALLNQNNINLVLCDNKKKINNIYDLPKENRSIKLLYQDLKTKVCKPFSQ